MFAYRVDYSYIHLQCASLEFIQRLHSTATLTGKANGDMEAEKSVENFGDKSPQCQDPSFQNIVVHMIYVF